MTQQVVFDLDHTLIRYDSFAALNRSLILRSWWRVLLTTVSAPAIALLWTRKSSRLTALSALVWFGTVGLTQAQLETLMDLEVARRFKKPSALLCAEALQALQAHRQQGARVIVATGSVVALASRICSALGLQDIEVVGSTLRPWRGGWIAERHCYKSEKVAMLLAHGFPDQWDCAYTDSAADIPLLARAHRRVLVNAKPKQWQRIVTLLGPPLERLDSPPPGEALKSAPQRFG